MDQGIPRQYNILSAEAETTVLRRAVLDSISVFGHLWSLLVNGIAVPAAVRSVGPIITTCTKIVPWGVVTSGVPHASKKSSECAIVRVLGPNQPYRRDLGVGDTKLNDSSYTLRSLEKICRSLAGSCNCANS